MLYLCTFLSKIVPMYGGGEPIVVKRALYVYFCPKPCTVVGEASGPYVRIFLSKISERVDLIPSEPNDISQPHRFNCSMAAILFRLQYALTRMSDICSES